MDCIEKARKYRGQFAEGLQHQGFPFKEAMFLTGILVNFPNLLAYCIRDLGRMTHEQYVAFKENFPDAAAEIDQRFGEKTRKWMSASTSIESVRITPDCADRIEQMQYYSENDGQWHID